MWRSAASVLSPIILRRAASSAAAPPLFLLPSLSLRSISSAPLYLPSPANLARPASFQFLAGGPRTFATRGQRASPDSEEDEDTYNSDGDGDDFDEVAEDDSEFDGSDDDEDHDGVDPDDMSDG